MIINGFINEEGGLRSAFLVSNNLGKTKTPDIADCDAGSLFKIFADER